ncbi:MAG: amino acid ABC transporter substrate-binding protein [Alteromonadales bacterium]|nr:amino acid ABC transporter substrate-binding protein [Alteromonadales bacterium]
MKSFIYILIVLLSPPLQAEKINISAIDWCPQICPQQKDKGYVVDLINEVYKGSQYEVEINYSPWSRAIKNVQTGESDALLSPAKAEAPSLIYPQSPVGTQRMCFFTSIDSAWIYSGPDSLKNKKIGIAIDTSIEELNNYVHAHPEQFQFRPYHDRYVLQNTKKLEKKRIDTFLFTRNTTIYTLKKANIFEKYREAGCVSEADIYIAFSPKQKSTDKISNIIKLFDRRVIELKKRGYIKRLMQRYGLDN